jgi:hypothetical protein
VAFRLAKRRWLLFAAMVLAAVLHGRVALACTCLRRPLSRTVVPADGAVEVPPDSAIRVFFGADWPDALRLAVAEEYRLRGPDGTLIPLVPRMEGFVLALTPAQPLERGAAYVVEQAWAYRDGQLASDDQRWRSTGQQGNDSAVWRRAWFPSARFHTAATVAPPRHLPTLPDVTGATYGTDHSTCGPSEYVLVELTPAAGAAPTDLQGIELEGRGIVRSWMAPEDGAPSLARPADERHPLAIGDGQCTAEPVHLDVTRPVRVRAVGWDASGEQTATGPWMVAEPRSSHGELPRDTGDHHLQPPAARARLAQRIDRFLGPAPSDGAKAAPGPSGCAYGLGLTNSRTLPGYTLGGGDPFVSTSRGTWLRLVTAEGSQPAVLPLDEPEREPLLLPADAGAAALVSEQSTLGVIQAAPNVDGGLDVWRTDLRPAQAAAQAERWRQHLRTEPTAASPVVLTGDDTALVLWTAERRVGESKETWTFWIALDVATGEPLGTGDLGAHSPAARVDAVGWTGRHFAVQWRWGQRDARATRDAAEEGPAPGAHVALIDRSGRVERVFRLPTTDLLADLAGTEQGLVGAWSDDDGSHVAWWGLDGTLSAGPTPVGTGVVRAAAVVPLGALVAVAGVSASTDTYAVATVDPQGLHSAPYVSTSSTLRDRARIGRTRSGVVMVHDDRSAPARGVVIEQLACRDAPGATSAPSAIAP